MTYTPPYTSEQLHSEVLSFLADQPKRLFIGGQWVEGAAGRVFEKDDPATGMVLPASARATQKTCSAQ